MAVCSQEGFRRIAHNEMIGLPAVCSGAGSQWRGKVSLWMIRMELIQGCEGLGRKSCSDEARYQEMEQGG